MKWREKASTYDNLRYSPGCDSISHGGKQFNPTKERKCSKESASTARIYDRLLQGAVHIIKTYGSDGMMDVPSLQRWNPQLDDGFLEKAKKRGDLYEPRAGFVGVL
jgi:hypothetical protein